ncbi:phage baseplate assembly protein V [Actinomadura miaoliensis]|uniref:Gp5/Type VI secretion system Vgr protein OB-fold domain-containing protein n=1 Tax=Actinomadura miaoliensis TaxID=430685 RepID=A0ABP7WS16_9ACTN
MSTTERILADLVAQVENRYHGKYRGVVVDNADPERLGRLRVRVPSVLGADVVTGWALPCVPFGGHPDQGFLFVPEVGAGVWVEFEEGDLEFPIWVGTYWSRPGRDSELPRPNRADGGVQPGVQDPPTRKIIKTAKGHTLQFEDADGAETVTVVQAADGHVITLDGDGIKLTDGRFGNRITLDARGVTIADRSGNEVVVDRSGIRIGGGAAESLVLGTSLAADVAAFVAALNTHVHVGNLGAPTSPPTVPLRLRVPLSSRHRVE